MLDARRPADGEARAHLTQGVDDELPAHIRVRLLARAVDLGDGDHVGRRERRRELTDEVTSARVEVRLEEDEHAAAVANRVDRGRDLGGMVRVVVEHRHAADLPVRLEAAAGAGELRQMGTRFFGRDAGQLERRERGGGIAPVVLARHGELEVDERKLVRPHDLGDFRQPSLEELLDLGARRELGVMVEVDVRDDGDLRPQVLDRPIRLVALDDQPARPRARVAAELRDLAADQERRVAAEPIEDEGDHPGRRRLAVGAGDDDRVLERHELREKLGPALHAMSGGQALGHVGSGHD